MYNVSICKQSAAGQGREPREGNYLWR